MKKQIDHSSKVEIYAKKNFVQSPEQERASLTREQQELIAQQRAQQ